MLLCGLSNRICLGNPWPRPTVPGAPRLKYIGSVTVSHPHDNVRRTVLVSCSIAESLPDFFSDSGDWLSSIWGPVKASVSTASGTLAAGGSLLRMTVAAWGFGFARFRGDMKWFVSDRRHRWGG